MKNLKVIIASAVAALQLFSPYARAETVSSDKEALRGIKQIGVEIGQLSPHAEEMGINRTYLKKNIELKLRSDGITVVSPDELLATREIPYLLVTILLSCSKPTCTYVVMVGLNERVHLARDPTIISYAIPWWRIMKGEHIGKIGLSKEVENTLQKLLNEFVSDYVASNPQKALTQ